eukprot:421093-Hanusia_phi.AAC.1
MERSAYAYPRIISEQLIESRELYLPRREPRHCDATRGRTRWRSGMRRRANVEEPVGQEREDW